MEEKELSKLKPIGVFDSGYGGLTILKEILRLLPQYDYIYLGDNARAPYGTRSFDVVYDFTRQAVEELFSRGCRLVILACNTASAKALRTLQEQLIPDKYPDHRVLGVILPTVECLPVITKTGHIGLLATPGTVKSHSYKLEVAKIDPEMTITEVECPMWVPLVESGEFDGPGADYFVKKRINTLLEMDPQIDTMILGCTHYPLLLPKIRQYTPKGVSILAQGEFVARSLENYMKRHSEIEGETSKGGSVQFLTTENTDKFDSLASLFLGKDVISSRIYL